jgi:trk system potassium uptake protein TrkH
MKKTLAALWRRLVNRIERMDAIRLVILGYASYVLIGWLLLCLPVSHRTAGAGALNHLFTAVSALSTTGLVTVSTADTYTWFGQAVILLLIQLGGLGYMTIGSFTVLSLSGKLSPLRQRVGATALSLPEGFQIASFVRLIVGFTLVIEALGAVALYPVFAAHGTASPAWSAVFHSISAFCTAGFGLHNDSFESYRGDVALNVIIGTLSYLGAIGFIVLSDAWDFLRGRKAWLTLTSKIILASTLWITLIGTVLFFLDEPLVAGLPAGERWMASLFQVMTASTTVGFNTVPIGALSMSSLFLLTLVMMIGASPSGTGGGIKTTSFTALWAVMMSVIRRRDRVTFLGREIPENRVRAATANFLFYCITLAAGLYALTLVETAALADQLFECASALGTVGLSRGLTGTLTEAGKLIIIALMFVGRVGPAVLGMAFFETPKEASGATPQREDIAV